MKENEIGRKLHKWKLIRRKWKEIVLEGTFKNKNQVKENERKLNQKEPAKTETRWKKMELEGLCKKMRTR